MYIHVWIVAVLAQVPIFLQSEFPAGSPRLDWDHSGCRFFCKPQAGKRDLEILGGTWTLLSYEAGGKKICGDDKRALCIFVGDKWVIRGIQDNREVLMVAEIEAVNVTSRPMTFDAVHVDGPAVGRRLRAIFQIDDDVLKICYSATNYPNEFTTKERDLNSLLVYKRLKP